MERPSTNDNGIEHSSLRNNNGNDNVRKRRSSAEIARADRIADYVCQKMGSSSAREFYCKAAYALSEDQIIKCMEIAQRKGRNPIRYLSWLLSNELRRTNAIRS